MRRPVLSALLLALALGGCGTVGDLLGDDEPELPELEPLEGGLPVATRWSRKVGEGIGKLHIKLVPAVVGDRVYGAGREGRVSALDAASGAVLWSVELDQPLSGGPGVGEGLVVVGTSEGEVLAVDAASGDLLWRAPVSSEVLAAPGVGGGMVAVRTIDGRLFGLSAASGQRRWIYDSPVPVLTLRGTGEPVIAGDLVVNGFDSGRLVALRLDDGRVEWERRVAVPRGRSELERMVDIDSRPEVVDDTLYVATFQGSVAALDLLSGNVLWERDMSSHAGIAVDEGAVYVSDADSYVWALDRFSGNSLWRQTKLEKRGTTAPVRVGGYVAVGDMGGLVHWLSVDDGRLVARVTADGEGVTSTPMAGPGNTLYVYGDSGKLTAYAAP